MRRIDMEFERGFDMEFGALRRPHTAKLAAAAIVLVMCWPAWAAAQQQGQKTFSSAQQASEALVAAARNNDEKAMIAILGPDAKKIVSSGDDIEDARARATFVEKYQQMHRLVKEPDGMTTLYIGAENWPTPIPLADKGRAWYFDTDAGKKEILFRRVGENEMSTMRVCQELVAAQNEYKASQHGGYAQKIFSDEGQHNGLYWKAASAQPKSPIGPLVASAVTQGYSPDGQGAPTPYHGYYYYILTRQGKNAPGGAKDYVADGKMNGGFAFVAYPAKYRSSGVMTFIVGQDGIVYQKDLGASTEMSARAMKEYNPDVTWQKAGEMQTSAQK
jgi:hypothetical protein